jgi:hypothetical protein|tara:strand:+ start:82 stop:222 length:141 start_codon:yes stop_codon:yes gene_type:complete
MKNRLNEYLKKLRVELVMKDRLDGWYLNWIRKKIKDTEQQIRELSK